MDVNTLMSEGLTLMVIGMGFVFVFLTVLVLVTSLMSRIIARYEKNVGALPEDGVPAPTAVIARQSSNKQKHSHPTQDPALLSVLSSAIHKYRHKNK